MAVIDWPVDKLQIVNRALSQTGDNTVNTVDDGSPEWNICSPAYEMALAYVLEQHSWRFATSIVTLADSGLDPDDPLYDTAYTLPDAQNCLHIIWVRLADKPVDYRFLTQVDNTDADNPTYRNLLLINNSGGDAVTAKIIRPADGSNATPTLALALVTFVMAGIYRGLHKDAAEAGKMWSAGEQFLGLAKSRHDQEAPKRAMFNSRLAGARRTRRPYPITPPGWTGTGVPS